MQINENEFATCYTSKKNCSAGGCILIFDGVSKIFFTHRIAITERTFNERVFIIIINL